MIDANLGESKVSGFRQDPPLSNKRDLRTFSATWKHQHVCLQYGTVVYDDSCDTV